MSDDFDPLRRMRPDRVQPDDPDDPTVLAREKERLMSTIDETRDDATALQLPAVYPRLAYADEQAALDYLQRVFGLVEAREARMEWEGQIMAWLHLDDGAVMIGRANHDIHRIWSPDELGHTTVMINVRVRDIDAHYRTAVTEGAEITMELEDTFYGHRRYEATDPGGHRWHFYEPLRDIRAREVGGT